jgi:hypothetical protein
MEHRERYLQLLSPSTRGRLLEAIREQGFFEKLEITGAMVVDAEQLPYLRLEVEPNPTFVARSGGLILDLRGVVDDPPDRYYLPYVGLTPRAQHADEAHELKHVSDLMELLRREPGFAEEAERLGMFNVSDPELLEPSVRFEVRKLFLLEVPAFGHDFDDGTRDIDIPLLPGMNFKYCCDSREEFQRLWLASYLGNLRKTYAERFPESAKRIEEALAAATNEHGRALLGERPWARAMKEWHELPARLIAQAVGQVRDRHRADDVAKGMAD